MRHFHVSENSFGKAVWSIDEIIRGHSWRVAEVDSWLIVPRGLGAAGVGVTANGCGFIKIVAAQIAVIRGQARFS